MARFGWIVAAVVGLALVAALAGGVIAQGNGGRTCVGAFVDSGPAGRTYFRIWSDGELERLGADGDWVRVQKSAGQEGVRFKQVNPPVGGGPSSLT